MIEIQRCFGWQGHPCCCCVSFKGKKAWTCLTGSSCLLILLVLLLYSLVLVSGLGSSRELKKRKILINRKLEKDVFSIKHACKSLVKMRFVLPSEMKPYLKYHI